MAFRNANTVDDRSAGRGGNSNSSISCSVCLDAVTDSGDRAWAKLQCGHKFHLDCIGSAFNAKGVMECPNCRKTEKGEWRFADGGSGPHPEFNIEDYVDDELEAVYEISYSGTSMWFPLDEFTRRAAAAFGMELDDPTNAHYDLVEHHTYYSEHPTTHASSTTHIGHYVASSSEIPPNSYVVPTMDVHYHTVVPPPGANNPIADVDLPSVIPRRPLVTIDGNMARLGSYSHVLAAGDSSVTGPTIQPYPSIIGRSREQERQLSEAVEAYYEQQTNPAASQRSNGQPHLGQTVSSSFHQTYGDIYYQETQTSMFHPNNPRPFHQSGGGSMGYLPHRHG